MDVPKLIIVAEHDTCIHTEQWLERLQLLASRLHEFPNSMLQIRAKTKPNLRIWAYKQLPKHPRIVINGFVEGKQFPFLHLPQSQATKVTQSFGMSIHNPLDPDLYDALSPLYYQLGPIFLPLSKHGTPQGCSLITETKKRTQTPIIAVGGITPQNTKYVIHAGAYGVASSGFILQAPDPIYALQQLYTAVCKN